MGFIMLIGVDRDVEGLCRVRLGDIGVYVKGHACLCQESFLSSVSFDSEASASMDGL